MITGKLLRWTMNGLNTGEDWTATGSKSEHAMRVSVTDAKGQLPELVRRAEAGEEVILTRHGHAAVTGLLISLSEWSDLPHVLGINEALIPWRDVKAKVATRFRLTPLGQFIATR